MRGPATEILLERAKNQAGERHMFGLSFVAHVIAMVILLLAPPSPAMAPTDTERVVMQISLGGAAGTPSRGRTPMGGRPVQQVIPPDEPPRPRAVRTPAAKTPEMILPATPTLSKPSSRPPIESAPDTGRGRTPTEGDEEQLGSAAADTGVKGLGFGLTTGGGGTGGYLDVTNFCCPDYLSTMLHLIQRNWDSRQEVAGTTLIMFTIQRDGRLSDVEIERSSGYTALDITAQRALLLVRQLPSLPTAFPEDHLTVHINFQYQR